MTRTRTLFDRRQAVRRDVELFRNASKRMRQLKEGRQGSVANPSLRLSHDNAMREIRSRLEALGHKKIADMLARWHHHLMQARRYDNAEYAQQQRQIAREISRDIGRAIEEIR